MDGQSDQPAVVQALRDIQQTQAQLLAAVEAMSGPSIPKEAIPDFTAASANALQLQAPAVPLVTPSESDPAQEKASTSPSSGQRSSFASRIVLT